MAKQRSCSDSRFRKRMESESRMESSYCRGQGMIRTMIRRDKDNLVSGWTIRGSGVRVSWRKVKFIKGFSPGAILHAPLSQKKKKKADNAMSTVLQHKVLSEWIHSVEPTIFSTRRLILFRKSLS